MDSLLAKMGDAEYKRFTDWWKQGNNMASWLDEAEKLLGMEEEPGSDIPTLKDQIEDNQVCELLLFNGNVEKEREKRSGK